MDPLPPTLTECSPWNEADTPRTRDLKHLRAKRVAYYESIGIIKDDASRNGSQQVSTSSQDTNVSPPENQTFVLRGPQKPPRYLAIRKTPLLQEMSRVAPRETEQYLDQWTQQGPWRESYPTDLDLHLLEDALVPETQKLRHVINWAQKFLSNAPEEQGLKSPTTSVGLPRSNLCQSSKALGSKRNARVRSSDSPPLLREDQSSTRTDIHNCSLRPQDNLSEMGLSSEFSSFFQKEGFLDSQSCVWRGTAVWNEGEGRAAGYPPDRLQQEDYAQRKYNRARGSHIQDLKGDEERGAQPQLRLTFEESDVSKEAAQSPPRHDYFWAPLTDSSEEECLDEPEESKGALLRGVLGRKYRGFSGIASSSPSENTLMLKTMVPSSVPSPGDILLEAEVREECKGAVQSPMGTPKGVTVKFRDDISRGEDPIQRLPVGQLMPPYDSSNQKRKESDNMGFTLWLPKTGIKHKNKWKHVTTESSGKTIVGRGPRGGLNRSVQSSAGSSPPVATQRQFDLTHPESYVTPQIASLSRSVPEGPLESAVSHGPIAEARGTHSSAWLDQVPPPRMDDGSVQTPRAVTRQTTHEKKEKTLSSDYPISRDISNTGLKGSFPLKNVGDSVSWRAEPPREPEQEASVLETYFYYLRMLNKIRGLPSKGRSCSLPLQGPRLSESEPAITSAEGNGRSEGSSLDRETKEWRDGCESDTALEGERDTCPQGRGCVEEETPEETSFWEPQGNYGKLYSATLKMISRKTSCGGYPEMSNTACSPHRHGDVKLRSQSVSRPSSAEAEERGSPGTYPTTAPAVGSVEKLSFKNLPQDVERENEEHKRDTDVSQWLLLPDEIWICIFSLLSHKELAWVAQVCHHFYQLTSDESLWKHVQISDCRVLEDGWLVALACRQPRSLTLHRCHHAGQAVTDHGLQRLFHRCGDVLQELNVTSCSGPGLMGDKVLLHAGALCSRLTAVDISWSGATDVGVMALIQGASSLQGLSINGCQVTDKAIKALVKKHGNSLHKIEVFGCLALTPRSIGSLALQCPHLHILNIGRVPKVSETCLVRSLKNLGELTALNVAGLKMVRNQIVHLIVMRCPKLDSLVLSSCSQVTDVSLVEISTYLRTLRYLDVSGCRQVTNAGIHALARSCHQLKYLDLSSTGISKRGVCSLANYCHISLECVKLSFCKNVTLDVVKKLCKNCRRLKILHLYGCSLTSDLFKVKETYKRVEIFHDISANIFTKTEFLATRTLKNILS